MSTSSPHLIFKGNLWKGLSNIKQLFIFGDSYSSISDDVNFLPHPTENEPLGLPFPGDPWTDRGRPNWVGHLVTKYAPHLRAYDYARGGEDVLGLIDQVRLRFTKQRGLMRPDASLFVLWVGINDLAQTGSPLEPIGVLFEILEELRSLGARNFVLIDVPPIHRTPIDDPEMGPLPDRYEEWNRLLHLRATSFASVSTPKLFGSDSTQAETSLFLFSSWSSFTSILDYPTAYDFDEEDVVEEGSAIWVDNLHPTSRVHAILAHHLYAFLSDIPSSST